MSELQTTVSLHPAEVELLCVTADSAPPFPLRIQSFGRTTDEQQAIYRAAGRELAGRGLADEQGPLGVAEAFTYQLRECAMTLDMVLSVGSDQVGAVVFGRQSEAVFVAQRFGDRISRVRMASGPMDDMIEQLLALIPAHSAARTSPFNVPGRALSEVYQELRRRMPANPRIPPTPMGRDELDELMRAYGIDDRLARLMVTELQPVVGNGQAGLASRGGYGKEWQRASEELRWLDTERGRFLLGPHDKTGWMSVNPLSEQELHQSIRQLAGSLLL